jgi:hypothetical protein
MNFVKVTELRAGDRFVYYPLRGDSIVLTVQGKVMPSKVDPDEVVVFTDSIGVLSAVTFDKDEEVELA